ncbi:pyridoxal phosphate-dependent aminotransferase [Kiloniella sp. b19]|uniref:pyridoxal phosphate-dependent aminotransferase n=1 Tax=Kiloniella sp. GXU_MW_B19 TaxID=3141326 RepID=UPI0031D7FAFD
MRYTKAISRLEALGHDRWHLYKLAQEKKRLGEDIIELAIGEPDVPTPDDLTRAVIRSLENGRTGYAAGPGEPELRTALANRYSRTLGREITPSRILCFPGTQTALYATVQAIAGQGDEIIVGDPMYATYETVFASSGASPVTVPLRAEKGFRIQASDIEQKITQNTSAIFLNTPHNPTGAVLDQADINAICSLAKQYDLWLLVDEVYDELVFDGSTFYSPLSRADCDDRVIVVSSISKSHAAPGFRSGWCVASEDFCTKLLALSEAMLFGNQPFIADATAIAVSEPSPVAREMCKRFSARADYLEETLQSRTGLRVHKPAAGMFALIDVSSTGLNGETYALDLLEKGGVSVMPGHSFGSSLENWIRLSLTETDPVFREGCRRIAVHANSLQG